jgi:hypothetical protein
MASALPLGFCPAQVIRHPASETSLPGLFMRHRQKSFSPPESDGLSKSPIE